MTRRTTTRRIDSELDDILKNIALKNEISIIGASRELAKISKQKIVGEKLMEEIKF